VYGLSDYYYYYYYYHYYYYHHHLTRKESADPTALKGMIVALKAAAIRT